MANRHRGHPKTWRKTLLLVLVGLLLAACSASAEVTTSSREPAAGFTVVGALAEIPASAAADSPNLQVSMADVVAAADIARVRPPTQATDPEQLTAYFGPLTGFDYQERGLRTFVALPQLFLATVRDQEAFVEEFGFPIGEVTEFSALEAPPAQFIVARGVDVLTQFPGADTEIASIGTTEDFVIDVEARTAARPLGRSFRIAMKDDRVAISMETAPLVTWLNGTVTETLADDQRLLSVARLLDEVNVVSATLFTRDDEAEYVAVGLGWSQDVRGPLAAIVLSYPSIAIASNNLDRVTASFDADSLVVQRPISELMTLESIEQRDAEIVALVRFPDGSNPQAPLNMLHRQDGPFAR